MDEMARRFAELVDLWGKIDPVSLTANAALQTPSGRIRGLNTKIIGVLRESMEPQSTSEIVSKLYDRSYGEYAAFSRKVVVAVSYLHRNKRRIEMINGPDGRALWCLVPTNAPKPIPSKGWDDANPNTKELNLEKSTA